MEEGDAGVLGSEAVVVTEARVGKVEEGGVGELGSGAVVMVVRVGEVEEAPASELVKGAVVAEVRVGKVEESEQGSGAVVAEMKERDAIVLGSGAVVAGKVEEGEESELGRGVLNELQALQLLLFERRVCLAHIFVSVFLDALRSGCINPIS